MNLLIIAGLFALGVVAILGALLLGISEQRSEARAKTAATPVTAPVEQHTASISQEAVAAPRRPTIPLDRSDTNAFIQQEDKPATIALNGQFHELADEIRDLHRQAWDLEQRLSTLTNMVDRIERRQNGHTSIGEELPSLER